MAARVTKENKKKIEKAFLLLEGLETEAFWILDYFHIWDTNIYKEMFKEYYPELNLKFMHVL